MQVVAKAGFTVLTFRHVVILCVSIQLGLNKMYIHVGV